MQMQPSPDTAGPRQPLAQRIGQCQCGAPVFFRNHLCLHCGRALGYEPDTAVILPLEALDEAGNWLAAGASADSMVYRRCANFDRAPQCNWLITASEEELQPLCRCCRLNRMVPDQSVAENAPLWHAVEVAKRRLVSSLIALGLPVASRIDEDLQQGLAFDLLVDTVPLPVITGHRDGIITLNVNEADDVAREAIRSALHEPYRTVLGHLRHESGHYYWSRLLEGSLWHEPFRTLFGDERQDYAAALQQHYANGPNPAWAQTCVSAYASAHPWEDWAETWAHYLHMVDTLDTATGAGLEPDPVDSEFLAFFNAWMGLTSVLNEFSLGMGLPDFYPFVLSKPAISKLHFVHRFIHAFGEPPAP